MRRIQRLINHWSVTSAQATVSDIRHMHLAKGWRDIGYHRIILHPESRQFNGQPPEKWSDLVKTGRDLDTDLYLEQNEVGAHTLYYNSTSVGICTIGHPDYPLHPLQGLAVVMTNIIMARRFEIDLQMDIGAHQDFNATECPGPEIQQLITDLRGG